MFSRFVALPVGQGDAFYLQRNDFHILVDGGGNQHALPGLLKTYAEIDHLDIVVCTHNDADHANGLIGLLEEGGVPVAEVWLPGSWTWRFEELVTQPRDFFWELAKEIMALEDDFDSLEEYYGRLSERGREGNPDLGRGEEARRTDATDWFLKVLKRKDDFFWRFYDRFPWPFFWLEPHRIDELYYYLHFLLEMWQIKLMPVCIEAGNRIIKIAESALHAGARIRLFEFTEEVGQVAGGAAFLRPVNACEAYPRPQPSFPALYFLALTEANKESLVFYASECDKDKAHGVLFCADSDLAFGLGHLPKPKNPIIATAPHHGSEANANAYEAVNSWTQQESTTLWVRSDCKTKLRPGKSFKRQKYRMCTLCNSSTTKSAVEVHSTCSWWHQTCVSRWCSCR